AVPGTMGRRSHAHDRLAWCSNRGDCIMVYGLPAETVQVEHVSEEAVRSLLAADIYDAESLMQPLYALVPRAYLPVELDAQGSTMTLTVSQSAKAFLDGVYDLADSGSAQQGALSIMRHLN